MFNKSIPVEHFPLSEEKNPWIIGNQQTAQILAFERTITRQHSPKVFFLL